VVDHPLLVGLTGSIGMGKSETGKMFARLGVPVYDADAAVHALYEPGGAAVGQIAQAFPGCVKDGRVEREALAAHVVNSGAALARLEAIVHPLVRATEQAFIDRAAAGGADMVVLNIPLLFETRGETRMDVVLVVSAPEEIQRRRVMARDGMTEEKLAFILSRQMGDAEKRARADYVVDTGAGLTHAFDQVRKIVEELRSKRNTGNA
jgi:dephospho-CoA kinase